MYKSLYLKAGGFDEEYREGAGYEDNDFINRLLMAGARFVIRDDLVVIHPKTGATIQWGAEKFARNEALYYSKWPTELQLNTITFCCVNAGNYLGRGREYVEKLYAMLTNCLPDGFVFKFVCFTDEPFEHEAIQCKPLPVEGLAGWDNKIALFRPGLFEDGERVIFLDLDTLLVGRIDRLLDYQGEFATLRDFWRPEGLGPAVMLWKAGYTAPWTEYEAAGSVRNLEEAMLSGWRRSPSLRSSRTCSRGCSAPTKLTATPTRRKMRGWSVSTASQDRTKSRAGRRMSGTGNSPARPWNCSATRRKRSLPRTSARTRPAIFRGWITFLPMTARSC
jgi:hypothetical protein